jgi:hypothetical protein
MNKNILIMKKSHSNIIILNSKFGINIWHSDTRKMIEHNKIDFVKNNIKISHIHLTKNDKVLVCDELTNKIIQFDIFTGLKEFRFDYELTSPISHISSNDTFSILATGLIDGEIIVHFIKKEIKYPIDKRAHHSKIISIIFNEKNDYMFVSSINSTYSIFSLKNLYFLRIFKDSSIGPIDYLNKHLVKNMLIFGNELFCYTSKMKINFYQLKIWKNKISINMPTTDKIDNDKFLIFINKFKDRYILSISNKHDIFIHNVITCRLHHRFKLNFVDVNTSFLVFEKKLFYFNQFNQLSFKYLNKKKNYKNDDIDLIEILKNYEKNVYISNEELIKCLDTYIK